MHQLLCLSVYIFQAGMAELEFPGIFIKTTQIDYLSTNEQLRLWVAQNLIFR